MRFSNEITFHLEKMTIGESNNCVTLDPSEAADDVAVIPRLAQRAEGPHTRCFNFAQTERRFRRSRLIFCVSAVCRCEVPRRLRDSE